MSDASNPSEGARKVRGMPLLEAVRRARIESADRSAVIVDLRDAEVARLEILNDALETLFDDVPNTLDLFDRVISHGDTPRLWIDMVTHVVMGRDKRRYRLVRDTRNGRVVLADTNDVVEMVDAITRYVARQIVERERMMAAGPEAYATSEPEMADVPVSGEPADGATSPPQPANDRVQAAMPPAQRSSRFGTFMLGMLAGMAVLIAGLLYAATYGY